jgi:hypothetical protein
MRILKKCVKASFGLAGFELTRIRRSRSTIKKLSKKQGGIFFIQIGANDGVRFDDLYQFVTSLPNCGGLVVEPLSDFFESLQMNYKHYPKIKPVQIAIHPTAVAVELHRVHRDKHCELPDWTAGIASLDPHHHRKSGTPESVMTRESVEAYSFTELCRRHDVKRIDYLQIDTEGFDWAILQMVDFDQIPPKVIKYEEVNLSAEEKAAAIRLLTSKGYRTYSEDETDRVAILRGR